MNIIVLLSVACRSVLGVMVRGWGIAAARRINYLLPAAVALLGWIAVASGNPQNGQVVGGQATITNSAPNTLTINQATPKAAIDWQSFNIAPNETTQFIQPSVSAVALNRVKAGDPSVIAGRLTANGQLVLINPSGIVFSKGAQVDVNALLATTTNITTENFMAGRMVFDQPSTDPRAMIVNNGRITVAQKGLAALVAPGVANNGVIAAKLGKVVLAGAETYTIDLYGDGLIQFGVGPAVSHAPLGADGKQVASLVSNTGKIVAPGGTVLLTADAVSGVVEHVVDARGTIAAPTYGQTPGSVIIDAGAGNGAEFSGRINVAGLRPGQSGGNATVTGGSVNLASNARIDARGSSGGGNVTVRSTGVSGPVARGDSQTAGDAIGVAIAAGAKIDASATQNGNGGNVSVWSDTTTTFAGTILANGGPLGGNGGLIETSSHGRLVIDPNATVSAAAPLGKPGTWLLDPADLKAANYNNSGAGLKFNATPGASGNNWVMINADGTLATNTSTGVSATLPMLAIEAQSTVNNAHQLQLLAVNPGNTPVGTLSGSYTLGRTISAAGSNGANNTNGADVWSCVTTGGCTPGPSGIPTGFVPIGGNSAAPFTGTFNGAGNSIFEPTMNSAQGSVGLFGAIGGTGVVKNVLLDSGIIVAATNGASVGALAGSNSGNVSNAYSSSGVSVSDSTTVTGSFVGGLVGTNAGSITQSYAVASFVTGGTGGETGGLVGENGGTISQSFAAVSVTNGGGGSGDLGGLVGFNGGSITDSYALGLLTSGIGGSNTVGGLVGGNFGSIATSYAAGAVSGTANQIGGLTGGNAGSVTNSYWDTSTTGQLTNDSAPAIGLATSDFQAALQTGFTTPPWNILPGKSYPYLCWQVGGCSGTPIVIAGRVYDGLDTTALDVGAGSTVFATMQGAAFNFPQTGPAVFTAANGYYYFLSQPGTVPGNSAVLTLSFSSFTGKVGAALVEQAAGSATSADIFDDTLHAVNGATKYSTVLSDLSTAVPLSLTSLINGVSNLQIDATAGLSIDTPMAKLDSTGAFNRVTLNTNGTLDQTSGSIINAVELSISSTGAVDLPEANTVSFLAGSVSDIGAAFDFRNDSTSLLIDQVGSRRGITTNAANIVLVTTTSGDIGITQSINANNGSTTLGALPGLIGISSAGAIIEDPRVRLVGAGAELLAADLIDLEGDNKLGSGTLGTPGNVAATAGLIAGNLTSADPNNFFAFVNFNAGLEVSTVQVSAGSSPITHLPSQTGVVTGGAEIDLIVDQRAISPNPGVGLKLSQQVNANGGSTTLGSAPGFVELITAENAGDITQTSTGKVVASQLYVEADSGNVVLTANNRIGVQDSGGIATTAGLVSGFAFGNLSLVNSNAGIDVDVVGPTCGCFTASGIATFAGDINLATVGTGAITVNQPLSAGANINIAVAPGYGFTNNSTGGVLSFPPPLGFLVAPAGLDTSFSGGSVVILADQISLANGTISTVDTCACGSVFAGAVVLAPATPSKDIVIGGSDPATLTLAQNDIDTITAGSLQFGYKADGTGTASYTGTINPGTLNINTDNLPTLLLVTARKVTQSSSDAITYTGSTALELGVVAGDTVSLLGNNSVPILAGFVDGAGKSFTFQNNVPGGDLTVGALSRQQFALTIDSTTGLPTPSVMSSSSPNPSNPLSGVTTNNGDVTLTAFNGGNLTLANPVNAGSGTVTLGATGTITQSSGAILTAGTLASSAAGNVTLTEQNQVAALGLNSNNGTSAFSFTNARDLSVAADVSTWKTITLTNTGNLTISAPLATLTPGDSIALNITGNISEGPGGSITTTTLTGSSVGGATLGGDNLVATIGGWSDTGAGSAGFVLHNTQNLTVGGTISSVSGPIALTTTGSLDLRGDLSTPTGMVTLGAGGSISQELGTITAATLTGSSAGNASFGQSTNNIATLGAFSTTTGGANGDFTLVDAQPSNLSITGAVNAGTGTIA